MSNISGNNGTFSGNLVCSGNLTCSNLTASSAVTFSTGTVSASSVTTNNQQSALTTDAVNLYSNNTGTITLGNTTGILTVRKPTTTVTNLTSSGTITGDTIQSVTTGANPNLYTSNTGNISIGSSTGNLYLNKALTVAKTQQVDKINLSGALSSTSGTNSLVTALLGTLALISPNAVIVSASTSSDASGVLTQAGGRMTLDSSGLGGSITLTSPASSITLNASTDVSVGGGAGFLNCSKTLKCNTAQSFVTTDTVNLYTTSGGGAIINLGGNSTIVNVGTGTSNTVQMGSLSSTVNVNALNLNATTQGVITLTANSDVRIPVGGAGSLFICDKSFNLSASQVARINRIDALTPTSAGELYLNLTAGGTCSIASSTSLTWIYGNVNMGSANRTLNLFTQSGTTINIGSVTSNVTIGCSTLFVSNISLTNISLNKITPTYGSVPSYGTGDLGYSNTVSNASPVFLVASTQITICSLTLPAQGTYAINYGFLIPTPGVTNSIQWGISPSSSLTSMVRKQLKTRNMEQQTNSTGSLSRSGCNIIKTDEWESLVINLIFLSDTSSATIPTGDAYINYTRLA